MMDHENVSSDVLKDIYSSALKACINRSARLSSQRTKPAKSTFFVQPQQHHELEMICSLTGMTKQDIYTDALNQYLHKHHYLDDIPLDQLKAIING